MGSSEDHPAEKPGGGTLPTRRQFLKKTVTSTVRVGGLTLVGSAIVSSVLPGCRCKDTPCPECMECTGTNTCGPGPGSANKCTDNNYCKTKNTCSGGPAPEGANSCTGSNTCDKDNTCEGTSAQGDNTCGNNSCKHKNTCEEDNSCTGQNSCGTSTGFEDYNHCHDDNTCTGSQNQCKVPSGGEGENSCGDNSCGTLNQCSGNNQCNSDNTCTPGTNACTPYAANHCHETNTP